MKPRVSRKPGNLLDWHGSDFEDKVARLTEQHSELERPRLEWKMF